MKLSGSVKAVICAALYFSPVAAYANVVEEIVTKGFSEGYEHGYVSVSIRDCETSEALFEVNADKSMMPASCLKAITTAATLSHLNPGHRFRTKLLITGSVKNGKLDGDLIISGGGDPTLGSDRVPGTVTSKTLIADWVKAVKQSGIQSIGGSLKADSSFLPYDPLPPGYEWEDIGNYYGAGTFGLCFHDNLYYLQFKPGEAVGQPTTIIGTVPALRGVDWLNEVSTGPPHSGDQASIAGGPRTLFRHATGTVPLGSSFSIKGSIPEPPLTMAELFSDELKRAGVRIAHDPQVIYAEDDAPKHGREIAHVDSPPLMDIVRILHKQSFNLYAEMLLMHVARAEKGDGRRATGTKRIVEFLTAAGVDTDGFRILDGSGLSRGNMLTAAGFTTFLCAMSNRPHFAEWRDSLPIMGTDGDLRRRHANTPLKGRVKAKTGYIGGARGLCGYLEAKSGRNLSFAIIVNRYSKGLSQVDRDTDSVLLKLYENY